MHFIYAQILKILRCNDILEYSQLSPSLCSKKVSKHRNAECVPQVFTGVFAEFAQSTRKVKMALLGTAVLLPLSEQPSCFPVFSKLEAVCSNHNLSRLTLSSERFVLYFQTHCEMNTQVNIP